VTSKSIDRDAGFKRHGSQGFQAGKSRHVCAKVTNKPIGLFRWRDGRAVRILRLEHDLPGARELEGRQRRATDARARSASLGTQAVWSASRSSSQFKRVEVARECSARQQYGVATGGFSCPTVKAQFLLQRELCGGVASCARARSGMTCGAEQVARCVQRLGQRDDFHSTYHWRTRVLGFFWWAIEASCDCDPGGGWLAQ